MGENGEGDSVKLRRNALCVLLVFLVVLLVFPTLVLGANFGYETDVHVEIDPTITPQVGASADDCEVTDSNTAHPPWDSISTTGTILRAGYRSTTSDYRGSGMRFNNITIPKGATISSAYLQVYAYTSISQAVNTRICAENSDNATTFSTIGDYNARSRTSYVSWSITTAWTVDTWYSSPDIASCIQTVVDRTGWQSGNSIVIFFENSGTNSYRRDFDSYDGSSTTAPKLQITYAYNNPPTIGEFQAPNPVTSDSWVYLNATVNDADGVSDLEYAQVELSGGILLKWSSQGDVFSVYLDPNMYCPINASGCLKSSVNATAYKLSWRIQLTFWCPTGSKDVVGTNTKVVDKSEASGSNSQAGLFTLNKGTTYTDTSTDFTIESSSAISSVDWDSENTILSFDTEGNIVVEVGTYEDPTSVEVDDEEWADWAFDDSAKNVTIKGVSSTVELIWGTYRYTLKGAYDEETGLLIGNVTVSVYSFNGESQSFELNSTNSYTYVLNLTYPPHCFQFELAPSINMTRYYYPSAGIETIYVWNATGTVNHYSLTFLDSIGFIDTSTYMEVQRYINGSTRILERIPINRATPAYLWLRYDRPYRLNLISSSEERVLEILADDDLEKELVISGITFSDQVKLAYKYVRVEAVRETSSKITINYEDTLEQTVSAYFEIQYRNGSQVWNATITSSKGSVSWDEADSETGYIVEATIDHSGLCTLNFRYAVPTLPQANYPFDFAWAGSLPFSTKAVVPVVAILFVAACFSTLTAGAGIVITVISAGVLYSVGWLDIAPATLTIALAFALIFAISVARRRGVD